jgi:hypothetical protein
MVSHDFVNIAARGWRAAGCTAQQPDIYDAMAKIVAQTHDTSQLVDKLDTMERGRS